MKASAENRRIGLLLKMVREGALVPRPDFQRRVVWTNPDKIAFIETILLGFPFPEIYIAASSVDTVSGDATEILVDGQQRIRTIEAYFKGASPFKHGRGVTRYKDLLEDQKKDFLNYEVAVRNLGLLEEGVIRQVFRRMNRTSYNLNEMERYNAVYLGQMKKFAENMAEAEFFTKVRLFSANDVRRMKDVSYIASLTATMMSTYFHRDDDIEKYLAHYNESFPEKESLRARFYACFDYLQSLGLPPQSRAWRKVDFYTLFIEVDRQLAKRKLKPEAEAASEVLSKFFSQVEAHRAHPSEDAQVKKYADAILRNTNDRGQRITRGDVIKHLLESVPGAPFELPVPPPEEEAPEEEVAAESHAEEYSLAEDYTSDAIDELELEAGLPFTEAEETPS